MIRGLAKSRRRTSNRSCYHCVWIIKKGESEEVAKKKEFDGVHRIRRSLKT